MSDLYPIGQPIRLATTISDITGAVTDPTSLTFTYGLRGAAVTTKHWPTPADIVRDALGTFHYDLTPPAAGQYLYTWTAVGTAAGVHADVVDVFDPTTFPRLVSFADAKEFLKLTGTADDAVLDRIIGWASARILREYRATVGTVTDRLELGPAGFVLHTTPATAVTAIAAVSPYAPAIAVTDVYVANQFAGTVGLAVATAWGGIYDVTYAVGGAEINPGVTGACEALIRHWWNQFRAHGSSTYGDTGFVPDFKDLPNVVRNMLASVPRVSGVG